MAHTSFIHFSKIMYPKDELDGWMAASKMKAIYNIVKDGVHSSDGFLSHNYQKGTFFCEDSIFNTYPIS